MSRIGVVFPEERPAAAAMAHEIVARFAAHEVRLARVGADESWGVGLDFVVSLGGDGNQSGAFIHAGYYPDRSCPSK